MCGLGWEGYPRTSPSSECVGWIGKVFRKHLLSFGGMGTIEESSKQKRPQSDWLRAFDGSGWSMLVDVGGAATAGVDAGTSASPCEYEGYGVEEEPEAYALILIDPEEDEDARDEKGDDDLDEVDRGRDVGSHAVL
jgi:hypothetical protein